MKKELSCAILLGSLSLAAVGISVVSRSIFVSHVEAATITGTGALSGRVEASKPFQGAQVYVKNLDNHMLYMVYTSGGRYEAVNLLPGNYEVSVKKNGFTAEVKQITIATGDSATADFVLHDAPIKLNRTVHTFEGPNGPTNVPAVSYDELYPPGPGRATIERTCMLCHGVDFVPSHQWDADQWNAAINLMSDPYDTVPGRIVPGTLSPEERSNLVEYLVKNYGPESTVRGLAVPEMPVDEASISKAMYVEYPVPSSFGRPIHDDHFDKDGNIWFTVRKPGQPNIGMVDPRTGVFKNYPIPDTIAFPHGITLDGEGQLWWSGDTAIGRVDPKTGKMTLYPFGVHATEHASHGHTPVVDSKQNIWFTQSYSNMLGKWDRETEKITNYTIPTAFGFPYGLSIDKKDNLWVGEWTRCKMAKFDPVAESFVEYTPLTRPCTLRRLTVDSQGMVWYALDSIGKIGKLDPNTGKIVEYTIPVKYSFPYDIQQDHDGNIWISDSGQGGALVLFNPRTSKFTYFPSPQRTDMPKIEILRDGAVLYTDRDAYIESIGILYPDKTKMTTLAAYH